jgi:hypothetical protein
MAEDAEPYAARLQVDYPATLDRVTTLLRVFWIIPIAIIPRAKRAALGMKS